MSASFRTLSWPAPIRVGPKSSNATEMKVLGADLGYDCHDRTARLRAGRRVHVHLHAHEDLAVLSWSMRMGWGCDHVCWHANTGSCFAVTTSKSRAPFGFSPKMIPQSCLYEIHEAIRVDSTCLGGRLCKSSLSRLSFSQARVKVPSRRAMCCHCLNQFECCKRYKGLKMFEEIVSGAGSKQGETCSTWGDTPCKPVKKSGGKKRPKQVHRVCIVFEDKPCEGQQMSSETSNGGIFLQRNVHLLKLCGAVDSPAGRLTTLLNWLRS